MRYEFIYKNKGIHSVEKMCKCMRVSKNAYYNWGRHEYLTSPKEERVFSGQNHTFLEYKIIYLPDY